MRGSVSLAILVYATLLSSHPALAQFSQQGPKLVGTGAAGSASSQGTSVSLSADGNTAIVGGPGDGNGAGAAWVWTRSGGIWIQQGTKLVGSGAEGSSSSQGTSVSLSADGNTAIVGGPGDGNGPGAAWVWTRSGGIWIQQGTKLVGSGAVGTIGPGALGNASYQGWSVSLSADGNTAIVGGPGDNPDFGPFENLGVGAAWVWTRSGGVWTQQGTKLVGSSAVGNARQGQSVALSADGNTAIVGGPDDNTDSGSSENLGVGAAWVWTRSGGVWTQQSTKLVGSGSIGNARQGFSVSLSGDGNTAFVGGDADNTGTPGSSVGAAWVFAQAVNSVVPQRRRAVRH
jgi:hypothetical protein